MNHQIKFDDVYNNWNNALPLGNGKMGAMIFFKGHSLHIALNHYDYYYPVLSRYASTKSTPKYRTYDDLCSLVDKARAEGNVPTSHYLHTLYPTPESSRPAYKGTSFPMAGEIVIPLCKNLTEFTLWLDIEMATVFFRAKNGSGNIKKEAGAKIWIAKTADAFFMEQKESEAGLWGNAEIIKPSDIGTDGYKIEVGETAHPTSDSEPAKWMRINIREIVFETAFQLTNNSQQKNKLLTATISQSNCLPYLQKLSSGHNALALEHARMWQEFWRTSIRLPDYFLETLWHLHIYLIECASGKGGKYIEQACGLNGLWDIRRPSLWGSMWYWDVNIQEAFWPVFSANKLELGKLFCDGYLRYAENIEEYTKGVYGIDGWALDYPHTLYNCIQPWCTQFLWQYYKYSGDIEFLRDSAYPVFQKQISFFKHIAKLGDDGKLHINYDISPEQGPISQDSVITIACIKWLLVYAIKSADLLNRSNDEKEEFRRLLELLPEYEKTDCGTRWKDSALAQDDLFYRHPSILMPIFPAEEISKNSPEDIKKLALNTLKFVASNTEMGVFGFGWLSCAAAKMGEGSAALRILYEQGIDNLIHSNGMGYEESERFINHCLITKMPMYPPAMTEQSGGIVMAVNTMLLQADDFIEVFPAVPNGVDNLKTHHVQYNQHRDYLGGNYPAWEDCEFANMLAPGGFEVSARMQGGEVTWVKVVSLHGGKMKIMLPSGLVEKEMAEGEIWEYGGAKATCPEVPYSPKLIRTAALTNRRIFLGEDRHTEFYKTIDSFTCAYTMGNSRQYTMTPYVFDFTLPSQPKKNYDDVYRKNFCVSGNAIVFFGAPVSHGAAAYSPNLGYGFANAESLAIIDRAAPDSLRKDFVESAESNEFLIELPRGKYNLLLISGDECEESQTNIMTPHNGGVITGEIMSPGLYQCKIVPFIHENDGVFRIALSSEIGHKWKLNALFLSKDYAY